MARAYINLLLIGILIAIFNCNISGAQDKIDIKAWFIEAESYFLFEEYKDALPLYQRILRAERDNYNVQYKVGVCYLNDRYKNSKSIQYLLKASENINPNFKYNTYKEKLAPPEALYYLGSAYHINNQFNKAIEYYQKFLQMADEDEFDLEMVQADIEACQRAKISYSKQMFFRPNVVGSDINTRFEDVNPVISGDGKVLAFTRKLQFYDGVFITYRGKDGEWTPPRNLTVDFGVDGNSYTTGISYFGDELYVYRSDNFDGNIYLSKRIGNKWTALEKLNDNINSKYWESHASPSPDGQFLYFTSNRDGGYGGLDIYKSRRGTNGQWGQPVNLGPVVNTPNDEDTPFLTNEGRTLFFSSRGHNTIGGYDIYMCKSLPKDSWSKPYNMGYPINSTNDDLFYCPTGIDAFGYYSYYNPELTKGLVDIYKVEVYNEKIPRLFSISGRIESNMVNREEPFERLTVQLLAALTESEVAQSKVSKDGDFKLEAPHGDYILQVNGSESKPYQQSISLKIGQAETNVVLPLIALGTKGELAEPEAVLVENIKETVISELKVKNNYIVTTDSKSIPIELQLKKGSKLEIKTYLGDSLYGSSTVSDINKRFVYFHKPFEGANKIVFKATDADGGLSGTEVIIQYHPKEVEDNVEPELLQETHVGIEIDNLLQLASPKLAQYLQNVDVSVYSSSEELFQYLLMNVNKEDKELISDITDLISKYYAQKDLNQFKQSLSKHSTLSRKLINAYTDSASMPMELVNALDADEELAGKNMVMALMGIVGEDYASVSELKVTIASFLLDNDKDKFLENSLESREDIEEYLLSNLTNAASKSLKFTATTEALPFYYQNLLLSTEVEGAMHDILASINFEKLGISTSPQLVEYLISNISEDTYTLNQLLAALENARNNKSERLNLFHEMLTVQSEGTLKSQLMLMESEGVNFNTYENYLSFILNQTEYKNYSRESVYDMLLGLVGITDIDEFTEKLISYGNSKINNAIVDTSLKYFSNPFELIQYLVSASQAYDFTTTDINNLLIRMILEQGMERVRDKVYYDEAPKRLWKQKKFVTSIILVNIVLIIMVILFVLRRKRNS